MEPRATPLTNEELTTEVTEMRKTLNHLQALLPFLTTKEHAIQKAVLEDKSDLIDTLTKMNAKVNGDWCKASTSGYRIPMYDAVITGKTSAVKALIDAKADPNRQDHNYYVGTPLFFAAKNGNQTIAHLLKEAKASPNKALLSATYANNPNAIRMLVQELGADVDCRESDNETPLELAKRYGKKAAMKMLVTLGADIYESHLVSSWSLSKPTEILDWQFEGLYERTLARDEKRYQTDPTNPGLDRILNQLKSEKTTSTLLQDLQDKLKAHDTDKVKKYAVLEAFYRVQHGYYTFIQRSPYDFHALFTGMSQILEQNLAEIELAPRRASGPL